MKYFVITITMIMMMTMSAILVSSVTIFDVGNNDNDYIPTAFASHGNPSHHEKVEYHKQQAMQHDEQCRTDQSPSPLPSSCDHIQAASHHSEAAINCHEIGDYQCASMHYSEAARYYKESNDQTNYLKHNAYSLHHNGIAEHGDSFVLPPRHQVYIVDSPQDIQCKLTHQLIFKSTNNQPLCVMHSTASHLVDIGWAHH